MTHQKSPVSVLFQVFLNYIEYYIVLYWVLYFISYEDKAYVLTLKGATTTQETNLSRNQSVRLPNIKTNFSSNIPVPIFSENEDKIFIFITTLGCVGFVLLTAHLIVYIIDRRRRSISVTTTCKNIPEQSLMYENINDVS